MSFEPIAAKTFVAYDCAVLAAMIADLRRAAPTGTTGGEPKRLADHVALRMMQEHYAEAVHAFNRFAMRGR